VLSSITGLVVIVTAFVVLDAIDTLLEAALIPLQAAVALAVIGPPEKLKPVLVQVPLETVVVPSETPLLKISIIVPSASVEVPFTEVIVEVVQYVPVIVGADELPVET
jgi:hypothetical protein